MGPNTKKTLERLSNCLAIASMVFVFAYLISGHSLNPATSKAVPASVSTLAPSSITETTASLNGEVTATDSSIINRGFEWGTTVGYGNTINEVKTWGQSNSYPTSIAVGSDGKNYSPTLGGQKVQVFDSLGSLTGNFGSYGTDPGQFINPLGIALDSLGNVYVSSYITGVINKYDANGDNPQFLISGLTSPKNLFIDNADNLYVSLPSKVQKYDLTGTLLSEIAITSPNGVAKDSSDNLYIASSNDNKIHIFDNTESPTGEIGHSGSDNLGFDNPNGLLIDSSGRLMVADTGNNRIQIASTAGAYIGQFGNLGTGTGQMDSPSGIGQDASGNIYISDENNQRIQKFPPTLPYGLGTFSSSISGLSCNTTYYYRAFATNNDGTSYGSQQSFNQPCSLQITTTAATSVAANSATFNANISSSTSEITQKGFQWGKTSSYGSYVDGITSQTTRYIKSDTQISTPSPTSYVAVNNSNGDVYVTDSAGNKIRIYHPDGSSEEFGNIAWFNLNSPAQVAFDSKGNIYIANSGTDQVVVSNPTRTAVIGQLGGSGPLPENLNNPKGVAVDSLDNVYISSMNDNKVNVYGPWGAFTPKYSIGISNPGQFSSPTGITIDRANQDNLIVADTGNNRVQIFNPGAITPVVIFDGSLGSGGAFSSPTSLVTDVYSNIYVADSMNNQIQIFNSSGGYINKYGSAADFISPMGVGVYTPTDYNPRTNNFYLFINDFGNSELDKVYTQTEFNTGAFSINNNNLECETTYHYRAVGSNSNGTYYGQDQSFTTGACNLDMTVYTTSPSNVSGQSATFNGIISATNSPITGRGFQWGYTTAYGNSLPDNNPSSLNNLVASNQIISPGGVVDVGTDAAGNIYTTNYNDNKVRKYDNNQALIGEWSLPHPRGIAVGLYHFFVVNDDGITKFKMDGTIEFTASGSPEATDVAIDSAENMYITYSYGFIMKLNGGGGYDSVIGYLNTDPGKLGYYPAGIDVDSKGNIFVSDLSNNRIVKFNSVGIYQSSIGSYGIGQNEFYYPGFLDIDLDNNLYVTDATGYMSKYDSSGNFIFKKSVSSEAPTSEIYSILHGVSHDNQGNTYITNYSDSVVNKYYQTGTYSPGPFSANIVGLNCGSTYHYRAYGLNSSGSYFGADQSFSAPSCAPGGSTIIVIPSSGRVANNTGGIQTTGSSGIIPKSTGSISGRSAIAQAVNNALQGILNITKRVPKDIAVTIPYLLIGILLLFALLYAIQSYRELRSTDRYNMLIEKYQNIQLGSKNFIALTSHYLNTPIGIMQLSDELLLSLGIIAQDKFNDINSTINNIRNTVHELLQKSTKSTGQFMQNINSNVLNEKVKSASFNPLVWLPIIVAGLLIGLANFLFLKADVFKFDLTSLIVQIGLFVFGIVFIILAWRSLSRNREIRKQRILTLKEEKSLSELKVNFIDEASKSIDKYVDELKDLASEFEGNEKARPFTRGLAMLASVEKSFELLKKFSVFKPKTIIGTKELNEIVDNILNRQNNNISKKSLKIERKVEEELNMHIDKPGLIVLIGSTLNNAIKFSKDQGTINISAESTLLGSKITIQDQGIGIAKDKIDQLMTPFTRATDAMQYDYQGLGISLYLVRIIIEQIGGSIKITSELDKGTKIELNIPKGSTIKKKKSI